LEEKKKKKLRTGELKTAGESVKGNRGLPKVDVGKGKPKRKN